MANKDQRLEEEGGKRGFRVQNMGETLRVCEVPELGASNAHDLCRSMMSELPTSARCLEVDLSLTQFIDSTGLGALVALRKQTRERGVRLCLLEPSRRVERLLRETHLHPLFDVVDTGSGRVPLA